ncbi:MAG: PAS domain S-box protein [Chitinophagaceae bacterium]|nr:PAS domain S-box protein [Chitinophagaceae bacterium]
MFIALTLLAELLFVAGLILLFFKIKNRFGYAPLYVLLGSNQYLQTVLATSSKVKIFGGLSVSAGPSILFSSGLFAILFMYIKEGVKSTQQLILAIVLANLSFTVISIITHQQELAVKGVVSGFFITNFKVFVAGTLALILDAFLLIILYEYFFTKVKWLNLYSRLVLALMITLNFDAVLFVFGSFWNSPNVVTILMGQMITKTIASIFFGSALFLYLRFFDKEVGEINNPLKKGNEDIFSILTYKGRYEKLISDKATSDERLRKVIDDKTTELEKSVRRFTILSSIRELRIDKFSIEEQAKEILTSVKEAFEVDVCTIHQIKDNKLILLASVGLDKNEAEKILPLSSPYLNEIIVEKKSISIEDVRTDNKYSNSDVVRDSAFQYISCLGSPMLSGKNVVGILKVYTVKSKRSFTDLEIEHLHLVASQIAHSQENSILFEQNEKHKEILVKQIVARKKVEEAVRLSNERFELIGKASNEALWEWNLETNKLWGNKAHQELYGLTVDDPVPDDKAWKEALHEEDRQRIEESLEKVFASDVNIWDGEYRFNIPNKGWVSVFGRTYIERDANGKPIRLLGSMMDITDRKRNQETLEKSEKNLRQVLTSITDIFYVIDTNFRITLLNKTASEMLSKAWGVSVVAGNNILELVSGDEPVKESFEKAFAGESVEYEHQRITKELNGWYLVSFHPVISNEGIITGAYIVTKDITERKKAQAQIIESNNQLRDLAAHLLSIREEERRRIGREIHDDLGQQLTAVKMDVAWIDKKIEESDILIKNKLKNIINLLDGSNQSVRRILNELKPSILDEYGLVDALEWHSKQFTDSTGIAVTIDTAESEIRLEEEVATCIFRICQEALTNVARHAEAKKVLISLELDDDRIYVQIVDDGKGFDLATAQNKGSFGLLGMHERARSLKGTLKIDSSIKNGTTVVVSLPYKIQKINTSHE